MRTGTASHRVQVALIEGLDRRGERAGIACRRQHSGIERDDFRRCARGGRDDTASASHRFEQHQSERLFVPGVHQAVSAREYARELAR